MKILLGTFLALAATSTLATAGRTDPVPTGATGEPATTTEQKEEASDWEKQVGGGPGKAIPDKFYPGFDPSKDAMPPVRKGGRVIVHLASLPKHINYMTENSAVTRRMLREVHESILEYDWETWELKPILAEEWITEDTLILEGGREGVDGNILFGEVTENEDSYTIKPISSGNPLAEARTIPKDAVESLQRQTVFTFKFHDNIKWSDGHAFHADDAKFTLDCYSNPDIECDATRFTYEKFAGCKVLDELTARFFYKSEYFLASSAFIDLMILPRHIYDLRDEDNKNYKKNATDAEIASVVNESQFNRNWVGLGPYKLVEFKNEYIEAVRREDYFNSADGGNIGTIRWRHIPSDDTAKQAVINGELDYWERLRPEDYFGEFTQKKEFTDHYYKGLAPMHYMGYLVWNLRRPEYQDKEVRRALAMCFDWQSYIKDIYFGLASRMTSTWYHFGVYNDRSIKPIEFNPSLAADLLLDAGWYDHDGDDIIDKDGVPFVIDFLTSTGNKASEIFATTVKESFQEVGIRVELIAREWATFLELLDANDFDCASLAWITQIESDPEQIWHSKWANVKDSSNRAGYANPEADRLIEAIQTELDKEKRIKLFHQLQAVIYEDQPYLFGVNIAKKFVVSKNIRNVKTYAIDPGYRIREWFLVGDGAKVREASETK